MNHAKKKAGKAHFCNPFIQRERDGRGGKQQFALADPAKPPRKREETRQYPWRKKEGTASDLITAMPWCQGRNSSFPETARPSNDEKQASDMSIRPPHFFVFLAAGHEKVCILGFPLLEEMRLFYFLVLNHHRK
ncbi:MAG: hypothetical protein LBU39_06370 [Desulfobulbaceae bacterium]|nr:hypothetical protein [Desulfobulbaceae bacterium]